MNKIKRKLSELKQVKRTATEIQNAIEKMVVGVVHKDFPKLHSTDIRCPFFWECEKSPFGYCVYDIWKDPAMDNCIYCGEPYKRK